MVAHTNTYRRTRHAPQIAGKTRRTRTEETKRTPSRPSRHQPPITEPCSAGHHTAHRLPRLLGLPSFTRLSYVKNATARTVRNDGHRRPQQSHDTPTFPNTWILQRPPTLF